jgi:hypothetical protein
VARVLSTATVLALLAASAVAFAITEHAKLERSPIAGTSVDPIFSPAGRTKKVAHIDFRLRTRERIEVWIENGDGDRIRTVLPSRSFRARSRLKLVWDGFSDDGVLVPDGVYRPVVKLERSHRTIVLPNDITLDTKRPVITVRKPQYPIISPDGDGHRDSFTTAYRIDERAHAILLVRGTQVVYTLRQKQTGNVTWNGRIDKRPVRAGRYVLSIAARDVAGNQSKAIPFAIAQVRYVVLARSRVVVRPGGRFALRVSTDAPVVHWTLHGRSGDERRGTLHLRAPKRAGVYHLYVSAAGHAAQCAVVVA